MSRAERRALVERENAALPVSQQCRLLAVSRSSVYRQATEVSEVDRAIMALIDRHYLARPYYGSRRMAAWLATPGQVVNRTPWAVYRRTCVYGDDRRCRPAALPPPARKTGKCSPSTTSPQPPPTQGVDIDEVNGRLVKPAVTITAIGADIETGKATP